MAAPRFNIFYGADSRASLRAVQRWTKVYQQKYVPESCYFLDADEWKPEEVAKEVDSYLSPQTLFSSSKLLIIKRLTAGENGKSASRSKAFLAYFEKQIGILDENITIVVWEEHDLSPSHPLLVAGLRWQEEGVAKLHYFKIPSSGEVPVLAENYVKAEGKQLKREAVNWLQQQYEWLDRQARLTSRLKRGENRLEDERSWWLYSLLDGAILRSEGAKIGIEELKGGHEEVIQPVGVFDIAEAVAARQWKQARHLFAFFSQSLPTDSSYFGFYAALAWQLQRGRSRFLPRQKAYAMRLLAEIEVVAKSTTLEPAWLVDMLLHRLEHEDSNSLLELRTLWLANLHRS